MNRAAPPAPGPSWGGGLSVAVGFGRIGKRWRICFHAKILRGKQLSGTPFTVGISTPHNQIYPRRQENVQGVGEGTEVCICASEPGHFPEGSATLCKGCEQVGDGGSYANLHISFMDLIYHQELVDLCAETGRRKMAARGHRPGCIVPQILPRSGRDLP